MWGWLTRALGDESTDEQLVKRFRGLFSESHAGGTAAVPFRQLKNDEREIVQSIRRQTEERNRNNVTRTAAYLAFFQQHPSVHWAFLAHMVSRNGGWCMTDVKGSLLRPILPKGTANSFFDMFERSNWLIFHDAYPQLVLYDESIRRGTALFYLLPHFGVSRFMTAVWQHFWKERDESLLTVALIVNEQQYIEQRIVRHPHYRRTVLHTARYRLQCAFDFNQVVFPVTEQAEQPRLVGRTMHNFSNVKHRIKTGRKLYQILFHPNFYRRIYEWAASHPHTGSRADYWPHRFAAEEPAGRDKVYSPALSDVWPDIEHRPAEEGDWYQDASSLSVIPDVTAQREESFYVTDVYERSYRRLKLMSWLMRVKRHLARRHRAFDGR